MTIGNEGSQHCGECSWWAQGPRCLQRIQEWERWMQKCHLSSIDEVGECVIFADGMICVKVEGAQRLLKIAMDNGSMVDTKINEPSRVEPIDQAESSRPDVEGSGNRIQKTHPFEKCKIWHGPPGTIEVVYAQVKRLLDWEALVLITRDLKMHSTTRKVIMNQGTWCDEELTMAWERYMQTEGLCQHVNCQHCYSMEKPIAVVTPGEMHQRRQLACFCTSCWSFTSTHHSRDTRMDISFFKQFNPATGKFHRALPYADEEHPRRIRGPILTMSWINFTGTDSNFERQEGQIRTPTSCIDQGVASQRRGHKRQAERLAAHWSPECGDPASPSCDQLQAHYHHGSGKSHRAGLGWWQGRKGGRSQSAQT
jgi:hypothetical protein